MRSIKQIIFILMTPILAGLLLAGVIHAAPTSSAPTNLQHSPVQRANQDFQTEGAGIGAPQMPGIRSTLRISIPYGFAATFPLRADGQEVLVTGHGSCTVGETFTVAVTVTHAATGDMARGDLTETCTGEAALQEWQLTATAVEAPLTIGPAQTCGLVQTDDGDTVTDEQEWCVDVRLGDYVFLPVLIK